MDVEQALYEALQYECAVEILKQEVPGITDEEIEEIVQIPVVKTNWGNAVPMYHIMIHMRENK